MRFFLALIIGKIISFLGNITGRGSNLPGQIALKIYPDLFKRFKVSGTILAVTGSNGKTSTANMVSHILRENGKKVVNNAKGSNLTGGVASAMLSAAKMNGSIDADFLVLEVDERYSPLIFRDFQPDYLLITNLFRDQLTRNGNVDIIIEKLQQAIRKEVRLIVNGNDPISAQILPDNERVYYGMERFRLSETQSVNITHDAKVCPKCYGHMEYDYYHYNHIGKFHCPRCGYETPQLMYTAQETDDENGSFSINGHPVNTTYKALFNYMNITAAVAACNQLGLGLEQCTSSISRFVIMKQRYEEFEFNGRRALMILSKNQNPVSYDQSISYVLSLDEKKKDVIIVVNNINHTHEKDTTWLYDISFERLKGKVEHVICCGQRAYDLAVRFKLAGFEEDRIMIEPDVAKCSQSVAKTSGVLCILTELYDAGSILKAIRG
ncbi:MAG: DUF1727 domain-containing protein [Erysipelotrichaceae bacterium]|nr:DUF1727 domain-containing protein [Erysipelotrichaceae bacterium]